MWPFSLIIQYIYYVICSRAKRSSNKEKNAIQKKGKRGRIFSVLRAGSRPVKTSISTHVPSNTKLNKNQFYIRNVAVYKENSADIKHASPANRIEGRYSYIEHFFVYRHADVSFNYIPPLPIKMSFPFVVSLSNIIRWNSSSTIINSNQFPRSSAAKIYNSIGCFIRSSKRLRRYSA